jgi:hypothetical protein
MSAATTVFISLYPDPAERERDPYGNDAFGR